MDLPTCIFARLTNSFLHLYRKRWGGCPQVANNVNRLEPFVSRVSLAFSSTVSGISETPTACEKKGCVELSPVPMEAQRGQLSEQFVIHVFSVLVLHSWEDPSGLARLGTWDKNTVIQH